MFCKRTFSSFVQRRAHRRKAERYGCDVAEAKHRAKFVSGTVRKAWWQR